MPFMGNPANLVTAAEQARRRRNMVTLAVGALAVWFFFSRK